MGYILKEPSKGTLATIGMPKAPTYLRYPLMHRCVVDANQYRNIDYGAKNYIIFPYDENIICNDLLYIVVAPNQDNDNADQEEDEVDEVKEIYDGDKHSEDDINYTRRANVWGKWELYVLGKVTYVERLDDKMVITFSRVDVFPYTYHDKPAI